MKKVCLVLSAVVLFSLFGCSSKEEGTSEVRFKEAIIAESHVESKYLKTNKVSKVFFDQKIWSNHNEDLNGDGNKDTIEVFATKEYSCNQDEPKEYMLKVCINDICFDQQVNYAANSYFGKNTKFEVVNINKIA